MLREIDRPLLALGRRVGRVWVLATGTGTRSGARLCMFVSACCVAALLAKDGAVHPARVSWIASDAFWLIAVLSSFVELREADRYKSLFSARMHDFPMRPFFAMIFLFAASLGVSERNALVMATDLLTVLAAYLLATKLEPEPRVQVETADSTT